MKEVAVKAKPYPKYKPSGVEWLGDVPEHWDLKRSDTIIESERQQLSPESFADEDVFHYSIPAVQEFGTGLFEKGESISSAKQIITEPVVLISKLNPRKATICRAEPKELRTLASTEFIALKARKCDLRFLEYLVSTESFRQRLDSCVQSVTRSHQRVNPDQVYRFWTAWPSPDEQRAIAEFLDRETARIDTLVARKRELIERLKEKRSALISQTVTRGLPPEAAAKAGLPVNPRLKPSGVEWLGDVPEHWKATKLRHYISILSGFAFPSSGFTREESDMRLLRGINVAVSRIRWDDTVYWHRTPGDGLGMFVLDEGTLVIGMDRPWVSEGVRVAVLSRADVPCLLLQRVAAIRPTPPLYKDYLFRILSSPMFPNYFTPEMTGVSVPHISPDQVGNFPIPVPPLDEQIAIAKYLDDATAKLDLLVAKVEEAIHRLQEHRIALITAVVTGKIDVRIFTSGGECRNS